MAEFRLIQLVAKLAPLLAPIPSAFFIGRSVYYHLLYNWHLDLPGLVNLIVAVIAGLAIEMLAISSVYLATSLKRWNEYGHVRKEKNAWEKAPFTLSLVVAGIYVAVAIYLLVVLESVPQLAPYSAVAFPVLAMVGAMNWALFQQHQDRLDRYGLKWSFKAVPVPETAEKAEVPADSGLERLSEATFEPDATDQAIMDAWASDPALSYTQVGQAVGIAKSTVGARTQTMEAAGLVVRTAKGIEVKWGSNGSG